MPTPIQQILKRLRKYEIRIRKTVNGPMHGDFHSLFKGAGLEFDDVRSYQYGDDVRSINWIVTAKGHGSFVNTFREEKEQTVFFLLDVSASQEIGREGRQKMDVAREICGVLSLSAIRESSQVGLIGYSEEKELYIKPGKGPRHAYQLIGRMFRLQPRSKGTNLAGAIRFALGMIKRRSVVVVVSDFIDEGYEKNLKALARKHDLVVVHLYDPQETNLPSLGIVPLHDKESGKTLWLNTSSSSFKKSVRQRVSGSQGTLENLCRRNQADYISIRTDEDYVPGLTRLFIGRNKQMKRG